MPEHNITNSGIEVIKINNLSVNLIRSSSIQFLDQPFYQFKQNLNLENNVNQLKEELNYSN